MKVLNFRVSHKNSNNKKMRHLKYQNLLNKKTPRKGNPEAKMSNTRVVMTKKNLKTKMWIKVLINPPRKWKTEVPNLRRWTCCLLPKNSKRLT